MSILADYQSFVRARADALRYAKRLDRLADAAAERCDGDSVAIYLRQAEAIRHGWNRIADGPRGGKRWQNDSGRITWGDPTGKGKGTSQGKPATPRQEKAAPRPRQATKRQHARAAEHIRRLIDSPHAARPSDVTRAIAALRHLSPAKLKILAAKNGIATLRGDQQRQAQQLAQEAARRVTTRQLYDRRARQAGVRPADMGYIAREMREGQREFVSKVALVLRHARESWRDRTGKYLTRNHPAFRGGDPATLGPEFELTARALARVHPGLLGDPDDSTACARTLYDMILAGAPRLPRYEHCYRDAIDQISLYGPPPRRPKPGRTAFPFGTDEEESIPW